MAFNETGHYKNVANLNLLVEYIISYGTKYAPTKTTITLANLQALYEAGKTEIQNVQNAKNNYSIKVDERQVVFQDIKKFTTRVIANLAGTNVEPEIITDSKAIANKIRSIKTTKPKMNSQNPDSIDPTSLAHSTSRQSFDSLFENFQDLTSILELASGYDTTEPEFLLPALKIYSESLKTANDKIDKAIVEVTNTRMDRNNIIYSPITGLVNAALLTKTYIKGLFGASSPEFKTINKINFKNLP